MTCEYFSLNRQLQISLFGVTSDKFNADDDNADGEDDYPQYIYLVESATVKIT